MSRQQKRWRRICVTGAPQSFEGNWRRDFGMIRLPIAASFRAPCLQAPTIVLIRCRCKQDSSSVPSHGDLPRRAHRM